MHVIQKRMFDQNEDQRRARQIMLSMKNEPARKMTKSRRGRVEGLGDIELFTYCDLNSQTSSKEYAFFMPVTFDADLLGAIWGRSQIREAGPVFRGGRDDPELVAKAFVFWQSISEKQLRKTNQRMAEYQKSAVEFLNLQLAPYFEESDRGMTADCD
jgi:hypothetical protein